MLFPVMVIQFVREAALPQRHPGTRYTHKPNSQHKGGLLPPKEEQVGVGWGELDKAGSKQPEQQASNKQQARSCSLQEWAFKEKRGESLLGWLGKS